MTHHPHQYKPGDRFEWQQEAYEVHTTKGAWLYYWAGEEMRKVLVNKVAWLPRLEEYERDKKLLRDLGRAKPRYGVDGKQESKVKQITRQSVTGRRGNYNHLR